MDKRLFKNKDFKNEVIEDLEDNEEETLFILNHYEKNKEEVKKWDSNNLLTRLELDRQNSYKINFCFIPKIKITKMFVLIFSISTEIMKNGSL